MVDGALQQTVGKNLRRLRQDRALSQEALADELGLHRTYIGGVERGERNLTLRTVERLAESLGVAPTDLLTDSAVAPPP
jgi:transcriptional regulator with XRE-family HTH domain